MPTVLTAVFTAVVILLAGNVPWAGFGPISGLGARNLLVGTAVPWAILPMSLYLWAYWRFIGGAWGPPSNRDARRANLRANSLSTRVWGASLAAGVLGFAATLALLAVAARLVELPSSAPIVTPPEMPVLTAFLLLAMQSIVAGVSEEAAFRGYMQSIIERRRGAIVAITLNGVLFGLLHFGNHPADVLLMLPYYIVVSAVYGGLTWAADSILPAVVLHCVGDIVVLTRWWATGVPEWQVSAMQQPLVWGRGIDSSFLVTGVASLVLVLLTALAYKAVHTLRVRTLPAGGAVSEA
ncbi:MAG: CPBP family intramembrane glutamic endopeptidase [Vicinamibacterales bacterium]